MDGRTSERSKGGRVKRASPPDKVTPYTNVDDGPFIL